MELETTLRGERYIHRILWATVAKMLKNADREEPGWGHDTLAAMVFAAQAFEAYLNYVGSRLDPALWKNEQNYFQKEPYRGFNGKVRKVFEMVGLHEPSRDIKPYSTIVALKDLRDFIAHGQVLPIDQKVLHGPDDRVGMLPWFFDERVSREKSVDAVKDVEAVAQLIHDAARTKTDDQWFSDLPFGGVFSWTERSTVEVGCRQ